MRSQILCALKLNVSDGGKGQMEQDRTAVPMLQSTEVWKSDAEFSKKVTNVTGDIKGGTAF